LVTCVTEKSAVSTVKVTELETV